jgi:hypothetical protein
VEINDVDFVALQVESVRLLEGKVEMVLREVQGDRLLLEFFGPSGISVGRG